MFYLTYFFVLCLCANYAFSSECNVVSKDEWGGLSHVHVEYLPRPLDLVIIQHTATSTCGTDAQCEDIVQSIQTNHMESLHFWDIGPNFLVGGNGKVYEGSGWRRVGAHTYGFNRRSIGISFIGNFNNDTPAPKAIEAAQALIRCGVTKQHLRQNYRLVAHRQLIAIESPGRKLYNLMRRWDHFVENVDEIKRGH